MELRERVLQSRTAPLALLPLRARVVGRHQIKQLKSVGAWLHSSRETTNFTYDLTPLNQDQLAWFIAEVAGSTIDEVETLFREINDDERLKDAIRGGVRHSSRWAMSDPDARYGCRIGWYALVRILKPALVVETGVDKGLGSLVIAAALLRNAQEGSPGRLTAIDIDPTAGELARIRPYSSVIDLVISDSHKALRELDGPIDIFLHDSNHSEEHERAEVEIMRPKLAPGALVLSDNAHVTSAVSDYARSAGKRYLFCAEKPANHWYPGGGIGAAFIDRRDTPTAAAAR